MEASHRSLNGFRLFMFLDLNLGMDLGSISAFSNLRIQIPLMLGAQPPVYYKIKYCDKLIFEYKILNSRYSTLMSTNQRLCKNHQKHQELRDRSIGNKEFIHPSFPTIISIYTW